MVLLKYLKPIGKKELEAVSVGTLPDPEGEPLQLIPSSSIRAANKDVAQVLSQNQENGAKKSTIVVEVNINTICLKRKSRNWQTSNRIWFNACSLALFKTVSRS